MIAKTIAEAKDLIKEADCVWVNVTGKWDDSYVRAYKNDVLSEIKAGAINLENNDIDSPPGTTDVYISSAI